MGEAPTMLVSFDQDPIKPARLPCSQKVPMFFWVCRLLFTTTPPSLLPRDPFRDDGGPCAFTIACKQRREDLTSLWRMRSPVPCRGMTHVGRRCAQRRKEALQFPLHVSPQHSRACFAIGCSIVFCKHRRAPTPCSRHASIPNAFPAFIKV